MSGFKQQPDGFATKSIHAGQEPEQWNDLAIIPPLVVSSIFKQHNPTELNKFVYGRSGNPTRDVLERCMACLDNGKYGLAFSSGLGATTVIAQMLSSGDHIIACDDLYGGSHRLFSQIMPRQGVEADFIDATNLDNLKNAIKENTRLIWLESPTNPYLKVFYIEAISKLAHSYPNIIVAVDNTFLTSYFQRPLDLGAVIEIPSVLSHASVSKDQRIALGISDNFLRISVGLEDACDLIIDLKQALEAAYE